jgi:hypothetical protein
VKKKRTGLWVKSRWTQFVIAAFLVAASARADVVTEDFVAAVSQIESSGGRRTIGDGGKAHGPWQMHFAAWSDTSAYRKRKGLPTWNFGFAHDPAVAKIYARDYLQILENQLRERLRRAPSPEMIYAAYNVGFTRFQNLGFAVENTPHTTRAACGRLTALIAQLETKRHAATKMLVRAPIP